MITIVLTGLTLDVIGTVLIVYTVLRVHNRVRMEQHIDPYVLKEMRVERAIGVVGMVLIIAGYIFQVAGLVI